MNSARTASRDGLRIGAMTLKISKEQKQASKLYELLFDRIRTNDRLDGRKRPDLAPEIGRNRGFGAG